MSERKIIHIDMDAFFASIEQRDKPELRGKPIAVGFDGPRGVVSTASYEARKFGVHSAMSMAKAKRLCSQLIVVSSDHRRYKEVSLQVHGIFSRYFFDLTPYLKFYNKKPEEIVKEIQDKIYEKTHLVTTAGISYNKFLAKIASDYNKPDGMFAIPKEQAADFIAALPIEKFWGVGPKTAQTMHRIGVFNGWQLRQCSLGHLTDVFGKVGEIYYNFARGIDNRTVEPVRQRKSVGCEQTFLEDISKKSAVIIELYHIVNELVRRLDKSRFCGSTLTLKVKFHDFTQVTRSLTCERPLKDKNEILSMSKRLMTQVGYASEPIRLIGLSVSNPPDAGRRKEWIEGELDFKD